MTRVRREYEVTIDQEVLGQLGDKLRELFSDEFVIKKVWFDLFNECTYASHESLRPWPRIYLFEDESRLGGVAWGDWHDAHTSKIHFGPVTFDVTLHDEGFAD